MALKGEGGLAPLVAELEELPHGRDLAGDREHSLGPWKTCEERPLREALSRIHAHTRARAHAGFCVKLCVFSNFCWFCLFVFVCLC